MSKIAINISGLSILEKLAKGQDIITKSTSNPNVPGNTALLATLSAKQAALTTKNNTADAARTAAKEATASRDEELELWNAALVALAGFTESTTGGVESKILSTGFDVRATPAPPAPVGQVMNVRVNYNGTPGYSKVRWDRESDSDAYLVQCSQDPIAETSWKNLATVTEAKYEGNGAIAGQRCWYRIAGVNRLGQGPWSEPALRAVM